MVIDSLIASCINLNEKKILSVNTEESVVAVEDVGSSQGESVTQVAGAGERELSTKTRDVPFEKLERKEVKSRLENLESVGIENACVAAHWVYSGLLFAETLSRLGVNVPCLEKVPLSLLMRRMNMWMWLGAVLRCIVIWNLKVHLQRVRELCFLEKLRRGS